RKAQKAARRTYLNQRKFAVGGLAQIAGLLEADAGFVLGAMLVIADQRERDGTWPSSVFLQYKARGDAVLALSLIHISEPTRPILVSGFA
ncbi:conjugal transfer protein TraD, partial [Pseudomonas paraeruginosa]|uniref:conjugal transfer protein TraD n=1 Tax=Pseudomonas paraeruginosa TaxID=2994495 RepID=UPI003A4C689B